MPLNEFAVPLALFSAGCTIYFAAVYDSQQNPNSQLSINPFFVAAIAAVAYFHRRPANLIEPAIEKIENPYREIDF